ncbi:hypothetical protein [Baia soyae]|uniref:Uncharacterized protein n=1 Tax=Baia soyae TaxID=1544746 RepID=A0A4R2RXP8_9BACL|nr:hypothetical protein [Baia soyae]TCP68268.1 hypothetical protein EDD57_1186 [Baia soyae]
MIANTSDTQNQVERYLEFFALVTPTPYGNRYTTTFNYDMLNDQNLELFSNKTAQRAVKEERAEQIAKNYLRIFTKEVGEDYEVPFQSSFVLNMNLKESGLTEKDIFQNGVLRIPIIKHIFSIRDGGHRKVASDNFFQMLKEKISTVSNRSRKALYEQIKQKFQDISFTVDIYIDLDGNYSKRCLLDLGKSEPVSPGREFFFIHNEYADIIEYLKESKNTPIILDLDSAKYSKYNGLSIPLHYVTSIITKIGKPLLDQHQLSTKEINKYIINFLSEIFSSMKVDTFNSRLKDTTQILQYLPECKVIYFNAIKRLLNKELKESMDLAIKKVIGAEVLYSKLSSKPKKEVDAMFAEVDLITKFDAVKELVISDEFKKDILSSED